jgi:hypothetical protein
LGERRYLAGVLLRDAVTGTPADARFELRCEGVRFFRNRRGVFVLEGAPGFDAYAAAFEAPQDPPPPGLTLSVVVQDPSGSYLPRRFNIDLPRLDPFELLSVDVFRSPRAIMSPNWAVIRARLVTLEGVPLTAAVARVVRDSNNEVIARAQSVPAAIAGIETGLAPRLEGEIVVPLVGVPVSIWGDLHEESVLVDHIAVTLEVVPIAGGAVPADLDLHFSTLANEHNRWGLNVASGRQVNAGSLSVTLP